MRSWLLDLVGEVRGFEDEVSWAEFVEDGRGDNRPWVLGSLGEINHYRIIIFLFLKIYRMLTSRCLLNSTGSFATELVFSPIRSVIHFDPSYFELCSLSIFLKFSI